jgi:hypothetical protein
LVFGQESEKKLPRRTACEPDVCISKVMYLPNFSTPNELQDVLNAFRLIVDITNISADPSEHTILFQGTAEQLAIADRLVSVLESFKSIGGSSRSSVLVYETQGFMRKPPASESTPVQTTVPADTTHCDHTSCLIKVLYLPDFSVPQLQQSVNKWRSDVHIKRITIIPSRHVIVLQGTSGQFALVETVINK